MDFQSIVVDILFNMSFLFFTAGTESIDNLIFRDLCAMRKLPIY